MNYGKLMVSHFAGVRPNETVCVLADQNVPADYVQPIVRETDAVGAVTTVMRVGPRSVESPMTLKVLGSYDVVFALSTVGLSFDSIVELTSAGSRLVGIPFVNANTLPAILVDYDQMRREGEKLNELISKGREIRIRSRSGSDLMLSALGQSAHYRDHATRRGDNIVLPTGAMSVGPIEDFGEGTLVFDASTWFMGPVRDPFKVVFKRGRVVDIIGRGREAQWLRNVLKPPYQHVDRLAEFLVGVNPNAKAVSWMPESEKAWGIISTDIGYHTGGGDTVLGKHTDIGTTRSVTMTIDDQTIIRNGKLQL